MNCFFEDADITFDAKLLSFISTDRHGYYLDVSIPKYRVVELMQNDILPEHTGGGNFKLRIRLNNSTKLTLNGINVFNFNDRKIQSIPISKIILRELALKRYSKNHERFSGQCYELKVICKIKY